MIDRDHASSGPFAVLGGGIVGLCVARRLAQRGREVVLVEKTRLGAGASGASAGLLEPPPLPRSTFQKNLASGFDGYESFVHELSRETGLAIEFEARGSLRLALDREMADSLQRRADRLALERIAACWLRRDAVRDEIAGLSERVEGGLRLPRGARVHPPDLLAALAASLRRHGGRILEGFHKVELELGSPGDGGASRRDLRLEADDGAVEMLRGHRLVVCAGAWTSELLDRSGLDVAAPVVPVRGQMLEVEAPAVLPCVVHLECSRREEAQLGNPYLIPRPQNRWWIGATVEEVGFDDRVTGEGRASLLESARRAFPTLDDRVVRRAWSGLRPKLLRRGGALIEPALAGTPDIAVLAGHYRNGILAGPRDADRLVADLLGEEMEEFSPFGKTPGE